MDSPIITPSAVSRRDFIKRTSIGASVLSGVSLPFVHAAGDDTMRAALIGCGGRGSGAASNALSTKPAIKLVAMADVQKNRLDASFEGLTGKHPDRMAVSEDTKFIGFDAYQKAMDQLRPGDVAIVATPLAFRWVHFKYAIEKGIHIFMEKPVIADAPSARRMLELNEEAKKKGIKVGIGLMCRHCRARQELFDRIQDGAIGDIILARAYRMQAPVATCFSEKRDEKLEPSELLWQIKRFHSFLWASGGSFSDFFIHNIDEACWMKNDWPTHVWGSGGRTDRGNFVDQNFDNYTCEYTWKDGTKFFFEGRNISNCQNEFATYVHGTKGMAVVSSAGHAPSNALILKGHVPVRLRESKSARIKKKSGDAPAAVEAAKLPDSVLWAAKQPEANPYDLEWEDFIDAIRNNKPYNELERGVAASVVTSMGRMACHTGQAVTYDGFMQVQHEFSPNSDKLTLDGPAPIKANAEGRYPVPLPGITKDREYNDMA
ncbi:MAG: Gfo/Idh/MocA family oxidoreductase [Verrucomicrobiaceae bacterium]|nr:Gfo/Idh/MocA family oxidoreductase [Verrucomicrobiaceae bacterium]